jgi:hypothetical protein
VADVLGPKETLDAQQAGRLAALAGQHARTCPWAAPRDDRERVLRLIWVRGYAAGRTEPRQARSAEH